MHFAQCTKAIPNMIQKPHEADIDKCLELEGKKSIKRQNTFVLEKCV